MALGKLKTLYRKWYWFYHNHSKIDQYEKFRQAYFYGPITYSTDGIVTCANADFIQHEPFLSSYKAAAATNPWAGFTSQWRVYIVCWFAEQVKKLPGAFVECGVNTGAYARAVVQYTNFNSLGKTFYLFDTFEGLVSDQVTDEEKKAGISKYDTAYTDVYEQVKKTFTGYNVEIVKGRVPETLEKFHDNEVCFLSIDMNAVVPEIAAAEFFWPKLVKGDVILLDDYGFPNHINQKLAFDKFASERNVQILSLPT